MMIATKGVIELLPEFKGPPNAFLVELFAMDQLADERVALDFLAEAFRLFPGLDYCTLAVPHAFPTFPLLDHFVVSAECPYRGPLGCRSTPSGALSLISR